MEVVIAMGHFCDTHGPCVILCTDRINEIPEKPPPSLRVPVCEACKSLELDTVYDCQDNESHYVTTRTSSNFQMAHLLKDAVLRSLSVEVVQGEGKDSGTMYFGDNQRGHIISHVFDIKDSLARGFKRKYCIVVLGKHQIPLLNHYEFIEKNLKKISSELQVKADKVNMAEQSQKSQRDVRQLRGSTYKPTLRSLPHLVGEPHVFGHLHMWFVFLLRSEIFRTVTHNVPECPVELQAFSELREIYEDMPSDIFETLLYCILTGIKIEEDNVDIVKYFRQLLPKEFKLPTTGKSCKICKNDNHWELDFKGAIPKTLPRLQTIIQNTFNDKSIPEIVLSHHLSSLIMRWFNIACVLSWAPMPCDHLTQTLEIHTCDMPLLSYWIPQSNACAKLCKTDWFSKNSQTVD